MRWIKWSYSLDSWPELVEWQMPCFAGEGIRRGRRENWHQRSIADVTPDGNKQRILGGLRGAKMSGVWDEREREIDSTMNAVGLRCSTSDHFSISHPFSTIALRPQHPTPPALPSLVLLPLSPLMHDELIVPTPVSQFCALLWVARKVFDSLGKSSACAGRRQSTSSGVADAG